jgi:hypothetical protein
VTSFQLIWTAVIINILRRQIMILPPSSWKFRTLLSAVVMFLFSATCSAQQPKVLAPHKPVAPRLPRHREWDPPTVAQSATGGLWMIDANFKSTLYLGSMLKWDPLTVTPVLHLSNGAQYTLPPVTLEPSGTAAININQALADQALAPYATLYGYMEVQYQWGWDAICGTVWNVDTLHSLIFIDTLRPSPTEEASPAQDANAGPVPPQLLEGMWWKQESNVTGFVALSNVNAKPITASVQVLDGANQELGNHTVTISPHGTKMVELNELLSASTSMGGLVVTWTGREGELMISASLKDAAAGYSARLPLGPRPAATAKMSQNSYSELGLMSGLADPMMNFPSGTMFTPYSVLRNVSDQPISVTPTLWWMQGGAAHSAQLATWTATPHQTQTLDVLGLMPSAGLKNFNGSVNLVLDTKGPQGALLLSSGSVDQKYTYVFEVMPRGIAQSASKGLPYWSTGNGNDTMITVWNPADEAQDFIFTLFYTAGHYGYPIHLDPRATQSFNISEIIHSRIPDAEGNLIPLSVQAGSAEISGSLGENQDILVAIDGGIYNVQKATCGGWYCTTCNGEVSASVSDNPFTVAVGANKQETFEYQYNTGTQYDVTTSSSWSSANTSVATVSSGLTQAVGAGAVTISAVYGGGVLQFSVPCAASPPSCPSSYISPSGSGSGAVCDFNITPDQGINAHYCNGTTENQQNFSVSLTSNSPGSCQINSSASSCGSTSTGTVSIDDLPNKTGWNVQNQLCNMFYYASGTSGQSAGNYRTDIQIKFTSSTSTVTHTATGPVTCP